MSARTAPLDKPAQRLVLGTVQFGLAYGIAGRSTPVPEAEVLSILDHAVDIGVQTLDTAAAYGDIELRLQRLIGNRPLKVVSKIPALPHELNATEAAAFTLRCAQQSLDRLADRLTHLMFHTAADLTGPHGAAISDVLFPWAERHNIGLGVSGYQPSDASRAQLLYGKQMQISQLPGNAFDQRIDTAPARAGLAMMEVHLRSAFLQGLLLMTQEAAIERLPSSRDAIENWQHFCRRRALTPVQAALGIVKSFRAVDAIVLGVDSLAQWHDITSAWDECLPLEAPELACETDSALIDPRQWKTLQ